MAKQKKRKRRLKKKAKYGISLLIFSVFILGLYGLFHLGKYHLMKSIPTNALEKQAESLGIDVSEWQNDVNFHKVKRSGYSFVMIRSGYGWEYEDANFDIHLKNAKKAGLDVGVYHYSHATTIQEAILEANHVITIVGNEKLDLPIFYDIETDRQHHLTQNELTQIVVAFLTTLEQAGYHPGIYAAQSWYEDRLDMNQLSNYPIWIASYTPHLTYEGPYDYWQYTQTGEVNGVEGNCDINIYYK